MTTAPAQPARNEHASKQRLGLVCAILALAVVLPGGWRAAAQAAPAAKSAQSHSRKPATSAHSAPASVPDPGERKFQANCGRCHNEPEQLSPRIVGTVVRHMRVRASLSAQDERDILRYLAP